ncbi:MAG: chaperone modulator CbpM [Desulfovibrio sp.]|nr:chaperone modulator CbpM [Desulfovibrio sp.]
MSMTNSGANFPVQTVAWEEFVKLTGISVDHLNEIIALGWITTSPALDERYSFKDSDIYRVRKLERICGDFELPVIGGTIIVDLLDRIDRLERMVRRLNDMEQ